MDILNAVELVGNANPNVIAYNGDLDVGMAVGIIFQHGLLPTEKMYISITKNNMDGTFEGTVTTGAVNLDISEGDKVTFNRENIYSVFELDEVLGTDVYNCVFDIQNILNVQEKYKFV